MGAGVGMSWSCAKVMALEPKVFSMGFGPPGQGLWLEL